MQGLNWQTQNVESGRHWKVREGARLEGTTVTWGPIRWGTWKERSKTDS